MAAFGSFALFLGCNLGSKSPRSSPRSSQCEVQGGWDRTMCRGRCKHELGLQHNAFYYLEHNEQNAAALVAY